MCMSTVRQKLTRKQRLVRAGWFLRRWRDKSLVSSRRTLAMSRVTELFHGDADPHTMLFCTTEVRSSKNAFWVFFVLL